MIVLTDKPIDLNGVLEHVTAPECGAEVLFVGTTRQFTQLDGRTVETDHLNYEAYGEMAQHQLEQLIAQASERWPVKRVAIVHRLGRVEPEEASVAVAVSTPHRSEAFEAAKWLIDTLKHEIPIWKQEHYVQNGAEWIHPTSGSCRCNADHSSPASDESTRPNAAQTGQ